MIGSMSTMIGAMPAQAASTDVNQCEIVDYNIAYYDSLTTICPDEIMYPDTTSIPTNSKDISTGAYYFSGQSYYPVLNTLKCQGGRKRWKINAFCLLICPSKCCMWRAFEFSQFKNFSTIYLMFLDNIACDSARR